MTSCEDDDEEEPKQENVDNGGNDQNQNGGNDQNQNGGNDQNQNGGNDQNQNGGNDQNQNGGNDQNQNEQKGIVGTWVLDANASSSLINGQADESEFLFDNTVIFNENGTFADNEGLAGKYSLNGTDLTLEYTEDGKAVTLKKGPVPMDEDAIEEIKEELGEMAEMAIFMDMIINAMVTNIDEFSATVDGDKLTVNMKVSMSIDASKLGALANMVSPDELKEFGYTTEDKMVFNRK